MKTHNIPAPDAFRALGYFVYRFARLENSLRCAVACLASPADAHIGHILVAELSFKALLSQLRNLYRRRTERPGIPWQAEQQEELDSFIGEAHRAEEQRNTLLHSFYRLGPVLDQSLIRYKATAKERNGLRAQIQELQPDDIMRQGQDIDAAEMHLHRLARKLEKYNRYIYHFYGTYHDDTQPTNPSTPGQGKPRP